MKKLLAALGVMIMVATSAQAAEKYGVVDLDTVINKYSKTKIANDSIEKQEKDIQTFAMEAKKKMATARTLEKKELETKYTKELQTKITTLQKNKKDQIAAIRKDIDKAIESVGKNGQYSIIMPNTSVLYGGTDVTEDVIKMLNSAPKK